MRMPPQRHLLVNYAELLIIQSNWNNHDHILLFCSPRLPEKETNAEKMATAIFFSNNNCKAESGASPELYYRFFPHRILSIKITGAFIPAFKPYL